MKSTYLSLVLFICTIQLSAQVPCNIDTVFINSVLVDPNSSMGNNFDTDGNGIAEATDEFVEICNGGDLPKDISGYYLGDDDGNLPVFNIPPMTVIMPGECIIFITNWLNPVPPGPGIIDMNLATPWINNDGDAIVFANLFGDVCVTAIGDAMCADIMFEDILFPQGFKCNQWDYPEDGCPMVQGLSDCTYVPVVLPIELMYFNAEAKGKTVHLNWATATEINNDYFSLEWSNNGYDFKNIGTVKGTGNSLDAQYYSFTHSRVSGGENYYRLIQVDLDGKASYSDLRMVKISDGEVFFRLSPNVIQNEFIFNSNSKNPFEIKVYNMNGQLLANANVLKSQEALNLSDLGSGMYIVVAKNNDIEVTERFIKR